MHATSRSSAIDVPPRWQILTPDAVARAGALPIRIATGPGFGDGKHPTTQLCLQAIAALAPPRDGWSFLDFGSGSGILSVAAALLGARVEAVEIDELAIAHAVANLETNGVAAHVHHARALGSTGTTFDLVVANILRSVLVAHAEALVATCGGALVLSGLVATDVPEVSARYTPLLGARPEIYERGEWRGLVWRARAS